MPTFSFVRRQYRTAASSLQPDELEELDEFLGSGAAPASLWAVDVLHGFLTSVALSPLGTEMDEWLPLVWNTTTQDTPQFDSEVQEQRLTSYVQRMYEDILMLLATGDSGFSPLVEMARDEAGRVYADGKMWCNGFMLGTVLLGSQWSGFLATPAKGCLLLPIFLVGSETVPPEWETMVQTVEQRARLTEWIPAVVEALWVKRLILELISMKESRAALAAVQDPCGCGSRKAYGFCCGAPSRLP